MADGPEFALAFAPVGKVGGKKTLEDLAVVGSQQVNEFVDDDGLGTWPRGIQELGQNGGGFRPLTRYDGMCWATSAN